MSEIKLEINTDKVLNALDEQVEAALRAIGMQAEQYAKDLSPVDTGRLQNSLTYEVDTSNKAVIIGSGVEYAPYVEQGTSKQKAKPYLRPAIIDHKDDYKQIVESILKK